MENKRIYLVHTNDIPENESFYDWSDEKVIEVATEKGGVYTIEQMIDSWNEGFFYSPDFSYMRLIEIPEKVIGYQVYEKDELVMEFDWWVFKTEEDAILYAKWQKIENFEIVSIYEDEIEEPLLITYEDAIYSFALSNISKDDIIENVNKYGGSPFEYVLMFLKDNGVNKIDGCDIAERLLKFFEL